MSSSAAATAKSAAVPPEVISAMEAQVEKAIADNRAPGAVLLVGHANEVVETKAFGNRSKNPDVPMTTDTVFDLASVSKVVGTATAAMLLIEDGKMTLDTKVSEILPEFAANDKGDVTIRNLMTHSSGLKPYETWSVIEKERGDASTDEALIKHIENLKKEYETGKYIRYSCLNYLTLARVNETVAGESQEKLLRRRVWGPLGMKDTAYVLRPDMIARWAPTFNGELPEGRIPGNTHDPLAYYYKSTPEHCPGNAGLFSTAPDLAKWCQMIINEGELNGVRVFKPETIRLMTQVHAQLPHIESIDKEGTVKVDENWKRGLGFHVYSDAPYVSAKEKPDSSLGHTGYTGTYFWIDKETNSYVLLLANAVYSNQEPKMLQPRSGVVREMVTFLYGPDEPEKKTAQ